MIYSFNRERWPKSVDFPYFPCRGIDADNIDIGDPYMVNTDTGECTYIVRDSDGKPVIDHDKREVATRTELRPTPIRFFPMPVKL